MLLVPCPCCGELAEIEFQNGGEALERPSTPASLDAAQWADYLFNRANRKAVVRENWWHRHGCGLWFVLERDTRSNHFEAKSG